MKHILLTFIFLFSFMLASAQVVRPPEIAGSAGDTAVLELEYAWQSIGGIFGAPDTLTAIIPLDTVAQWEHYYIDAGDITGIGDQESSVILTRLTRLQDHASDTYTSDLFIFTIDIHYEIDKPGSKNELPD